MFETLDVAVLVVYLAGVSALGTWLGRRQRDARDYFLGGRDLPWYAVLVSVVATETSTLTFLSIPGLAYLTDLSFLQLAAGYLIGRTAIAFTLIPAFFAGEASTAYALLEQRFGVGVRRLASALFLVTRALADSVRLFATAIPLALITGWGYPLSILVIGLATLVYTYYGGIRAVVWIDVVQTALYIGGGAIALYLLHRLLPAGLGGALAAAAAEGKLRVLVPSLDLTRNYTLLSGLVGGAFLSMASHGADQLIVQRLLTCRSTRAGQAALIGSGAAVIAQFALFLVLGLGLWAYYGGAGFERSDEIFARFILEGMPVGLRGLLVAGILAAAMSSLSSSLNSLSSSTTLDIYGPLRGMSLTARDTLRAGRAFTLVWAAVVIGVATTLRSTDTPVVELGLAIASFTYGGLLGAFFLGMWGRRVAEPDAILGMTAGILAMVAVVGGTPLAWPWYVLVGSSVTLAVGWASGGARRAWAGRREGVAERAGGRGEDR